MRKAYILETVFNGFKNGEFSSHNIFVPESSRCLSSCKQFSTYSFINEIGEFDDMQFNGVRIIPDVDCSNIPGKKCCADNKLINLQISSGKVYQKPSLFEDVPAGVFEEKRRHLKKYLYPIFIPKDPDELAKLLNRFTNKLNPDGQADGEHQFELLIEYLGKFQAFVNWDKNKGENNKYSKLHFHAYNDPSFWGKLIVELGCDLSHTRFKKMRSYRYSGLDDKILNTIFFKYKSGCEVLDYAQTFGYFSVLRDNRFNRKKMTLNFHTIFSNTGASLQLLNILPKEMERRIIEKCSLCEHCKRK